MDLTFVFCPNLIGILGLSILLVFTSFNFFLDKKKLNMFRIAAIVNIVIIVFEVMDYLLGQADFSTAYLLRRVTSATGFALSPIFPLILVHICSRSKLNHWIYVPAAVNLVMCYASIFTGHMFLIDSWNSYYRGPLFPVMLAISALYMLLLFYISFKNFKSMRTNESVFLLCLAVTIVVTNLLEIILAFHFLIWNSCAVLLVCYYLFLHIQYFKYDPLTNVFNRGVYVSDLERMKGAENVSVLSFDLDHLKAVNDKKGHDQGDAYIIASAQLMEQCFSDLGSLYRVGGDEFVVLTSGSTEEILRRKVEDFQKICLQNGLSVSCGCSFCRSGVDLEQMIRDADQEMYNNKRCRQLNR